MAAHQDGVGRAIIRATMGATGIDAKLAQNATGALAAGCAIGAYHLFRGEKDPIQQADHFLATTSAYDFALPLCIDVEEIDPPHPLTPNGMAEALFKLCNRLEEVTGLTPAIYTRASYWDVAVGSARDQYFSTLPFWLAMYNDHVIAPDLPRGISDWWLWQFTSSGSVDGIVGRVDLNRERDSAPSSEGRDTGTNVPVPEPIPEKFTLLRPVGSSAVLVQNNLFGAHPERYKSFGLSGHDGLDYGGKLDAPIYAAADGVVKLIAADTHDPVKNPYGNQVRLSHNVGDEKYETIYAHMNRFVTTLKQGDTVKAGEQIGFMGDTGNSDGVHLHLAVKWLGSTAAGFKQTLPDGRVLVFEKDLVNPALFGS